MEKLGNLRQDVDECTRIFDDAQDHYAAEMYDFLSKEQVYTRKIQELVMLQITHYTNGAAQLQAMLPEFGKKLSQYHYYTMIVFCVLKMRPFWQAIT